MMIRIGNFFFHYRNALFPLAYVLLFLNGPGLFPDYWIAVTLGLIVALAGQALRALTIGLEYIIRGGRNRQVYAEKLVQGGIFAHCRNPLYVGNFLIILGLGIASNSRLFLAIGIPFFLFAYWAIIAAEESFLRGKFGDEFAAYCARVNRIVPRFSGLGTTLQGMQFNWRRLISAEYGSTYAWLTAAILLTLKHLWTHGDYRSRLGVVWTLWAFLLFATVAYGIARYLKKSGALRTA
jgi:protein-S-isoprenylcysteine O-methyltransferase Ste14